MPQYKIIKNDGSEILISADQYQLRNSQFIFTAGNNVVESYSSTDVRDIVLNNLNENADSDGYQMINS